MARFDVYRPTGLPARYAVDVQSDILSELSSRVVIPLFPVQSSSERPLEKLKPVLTIEGQDFILATTDLGMVPTLALGKPVANVEAEHREVITAAMDFLFDGY